jgi:hypothetical protein
VVQRARYALRPWPWILVALASMLVFPTLADIQAAFPESRSGADRPRHRVSRDAHLLPNGFRGLIVAALLAGLRLHDDDALELGIVVPHPRLLASLRESAGDRRRLHPQLGAS